MDRVSVTIISRASYGLKSSGVVWSATLAETLVSMGYLATDSDPDLWLKQDVNPSGEEYYVENIPHLAHYPKKYIDALNCT